MGPIREFIHNYPHITLWGIVTLFVLLPLLLTGICKLVESIADAVREARQERAQLREHEFENKLDGKQRKLFHLYDEAVRQYEQYNSLNKCPYSSSDSEVLHEAIEMVKTLTSQAKDRLLELDDMIAEMRALKDRSAELSSEMDDAESRLDDVERRTKVIMQMSGKVNIMTDFFDMLDKDGFWEPIRKEQEYETRKRRNATINRRIPHLS